MASGRSTNQPGTPALDSGAPLEPRRLLRYASVVGSVAVAALLRVPLQPILGSRAAYVNLFPAIVYSAWVAGLGGGLLATALCAVLAASFILPHAPARRVADPADQLSLLVFVVVGVAISVLGQAQRLAQRRAEESAAVLRDSEASKAAILEAALDCIIKIDERGAVVEWNPAAERTFGHPRSAALGQTLAELIIPPSLRGAHAGGLAHYLATGEGPILNRRIEVPALRADGTEFPVELAVVPVPLSGRTLFVAYLRDLTERERLAAQQRAFLRDVLLSVTEGRLHLCHSPADLPAPLSPFGGPVSLTREGGLRELRLLSMDAAAGMSDEVKHDLVTAVSEAGMNAVVHAGGGTGQVSVGEGGTVQVRVEDHGAGIDTASLPRATLARGFSTKATLGHGLKLMLETADHLYLLTGPEGTTVVLEQERERPLPAWL